MLNKSHPNPRKLNSYQCKHKFSLIVYLGDGYHFKTFFESLTTQTTILDEHIELICIDDGSNYSARKYVEQNRKYFSCLHIVETTQKGRIAACNLGMDKATGQWLSFPSTYDYIDAKYLEAVDSFLLQTKAMKNAKDVGMLCCRRFVHNESLDVVLDFNFLRSYFVNEKRYYAPIDDEFYPEVVNTSVFYRKDLVEKYNVNCDENIPSFFAGQALNMHMLHALYVESQKSKELNQEPMYMALVHDAVYYGRTMLGGTSFRDLMSREAGFYDDIFEYGYIELAQKFLNKSGILPQFAQELIFYTITVQGGFFSSPIGMYNDVIKRKELEKNIINSLRYIDVERICNKTIWQGHEFLETYMNQQGHNKDYSRIQINIESYSSKNNELCVRYIAEKQLIFMQNGQELQPSVLKKRTRSFLGVQSKPEYICYFTLINNTPITLECSNNQQNDNAYFVLNNAKNVSFSREYDVCAYHKELDVNISPRQVWVLMDVHTQADDNAEHLYWYVQKNRPDIEAYFVLSPKSLHWQRMQEQGAKLLAHGSQEHVVALAACTCLISSHMHIFNEAYGLLNKANLTTSLKKIFLGHGYMRVDMSAYAVGDENMFIVGTKREYDMVANDGTWNYSAKNVALTGYPRTDALLKDVPKPAKSIMCMPTWRSYLPAKVGNNWQLHEQEQNMVLTSNYFQTWKNFLHAPQLEYILTKYGYSLVFWPHKMIQAFLPLFEMPAYITLPDFSKSPSIQDVFRNSAIYVTDYSSAAFDFAQLRRPIVYYDFENLDMSKGVHNCFSIPTDFYEKCGFGNSAQTQDGLFVALENAILADGVVEEQYLQRINDEFTFSDGRCCERVVSSILNLF